MPGSATCPDASAIVTVAVSNTVNAGVGGSITVCENSNTFNMSVSEPDRLERQFALATRVAMSIPVKTLSYPRQFGMLAAAREAILEDLGKKVKSRE